MKPPARRALQICSMTVSPPRHEPFLERFWSSWASRVSLICSRMASSPCDQPLSISRRSLADSSWRRRLGSCPPRAEEDSDGDEAYAWLSSAAAAAGAALDAVLDPPRRGCQDRASAARCRGSSARGLAATSAPRANSTDDAVAGTAVAKEALVYLEVYLEGAPDAARGEPALVSVVVSGIRGRASPKASVRGTPR